MNNQTTQDQLSNKNHPKEMPEVFPIRQHILSVIIDLSNGFHFQEWG